MSILIAWALIGVVFFAGIAAERRRWDMRDALEFVPVLLLVVVLWPAGLAYWVVTGRRRKNARGGRTDG